MTRVHDMGGRFGDGAVVPEPENELFHADWHKRALAITLATGTLGKWNIDTSRHARESLSPQDYTRFSYYEKWMGGLATLLVDTGLVTRDELAGTAAPDPSPHADRALAADRVAAVLAKGGPADRPSDIAPVFKVGDRVTARPVPENVQVNGVILINDFTGFTTKHMSSINMGEMKKFSTAMQVSHNAPLITIEI